MSPFSLWNTSVPVEKRMRSAALGESLIAGRLFATEIGGADLGRAAARRRTT